MFCVEATLFGVVSKRNQQENPQIVSGMVSFLHAPKTCTRRLICDVCESRREPGDSWKPEAGFFTCFFEPRTARGEWCMVSLHRCNLLYSHFKVRVSGQRPSWPVGTNPLHQQRLDILLREEYVAQETQDKSLQGSLERRPCRRHKFCFRRCIATNKRQPIAECF